MRYVTEELELLFCAEPRARELFETEFERGVALYLRSLKQDSEREIEHDNLVATCASAFAPGKVLSNETGFTFFSTEPLFELVFSESQETGRSPKCFDLLLTKPPVQAVIAAECKAAKLSVNLYTYTDDVREAWTKAKEFWDHVSYLSEMVGFAIKRAEFVLCVRDREINRAAKSLFTAENDMLQSQGASSPPEPLKLWLCLLEHNRRLQLNRSMQRRKEEWSCHQDRELNRLLGDGVDLEGEEIDPPCFASSHSLHQANAVILSLLQTKLSSGLREDPQFGLITRQEVESFFAESIMHYAANEIAPHLTDTFLRNSLEFDLLRSAGEDGFRLKVSGRRLYTMVKDFEERYARGLAERKAAKHAADIVLKRYKEIMPPLFPKLTKE